MGTRVVSDGLRIRIEQHIARGDSAAFIAARIGCSETDVWHVWNYLEAVNETPPAVPTPPRPSREPRSRELRPCGTVSAYERHLRRGEPTDPACRAAAKARKAEHRKDGAA